MSNYTTKPFSFLANGELITMVFCQKCKEFEQCTTVHCLCCGCNILRHRTITGYVREQDVGF
jgi:hypothetical protein